MPHAPGSRSKELSSVLRGPGQRSHLAARCQGCSGRAARACSGLLPSTWPRGRMDNMHTPFQLSRPPPVLLKLPCRLNHYNFSESTGVRLRASAPSDAVKSGKVMGTARWRLPIARGKSFHAFSSRCQAQFHAVTAARSSLV